MPRQQSVSNEAILSAARGVLAEGGRDGFTFAQVGARAGLAAATLVQRYGSKAALLQAALLQAWDALDAQTAALDGECAPDVDGAIALLAALTGGDGEVEAYGAGLLLLREDMSDPVLRARGAAWGRVLAKALGRRLTDDPMRQAGLGRLMASQWQGAQLWWAFSRDLPAREAIAEELRLWCAVVLGPKR